MTDPSEAVAAMPPINEPAPDFTATATHGERNLPDYRGSIHKAERGP